MDAPHPKGGRHHAWILALVLGALNIATAAARSAGQACSSNAMCTGSSDATQQGVCRGGVCCGPAVSAPDDRCTACTAIDSVLPAPPASAQACNATWQLDQVTAWHDGYAYQLLSGLPVAEVGTSCQDTRLPVPPGWEPAPNDHAVARSVVACYPFSSNAVVLPAEGTAGGGGHSYYSLQPDAYAAAGTTKEKSRQLYSDSIGMRPSTCGQGPAQVLIRQPDASGLGTALSPGSCRACAPGMFLTDSGTCAQCNSSTLHFLAADGVCAQKHAAGTRCNTDSECLGLGGCTGGVCCQAATPGCAACGLPHVPEYTAELSCRGGGCSVQHTFSVDGWRSGSSEAYLTLEQSGDLNNELGHEYTTLRVGEWTLGKCNTDSLFWRVCPQTDDRDVAMDVAADGVLTVAATASAGVTVYEGPTNSTLGVRLRLRVVVPSGQCERCTLPLVLRANGSCTIATTTTIATTATLASTMGLRGAGQACSSNAMCTGSSDATQQGVCRGGVCCGPAVSAPDDRCTACTAIDSVLPAPPASAQACNATWQLDQVTAWHDGYAYQLLSGLPVAEVGTSCQDTRLPVPPGWEPAPNDHAVARSVVACYPFSSNAVVLPAEGTAGGGGHSYYSLQPDAYAAAGTTKEKSRQLYSDSIGMRPSTCGQGPAQVLIRQPDASGLGTALSPGSCRACAPGMFLTDSGTCAQCNSSTLHFLAADGVCAQKHAAGTRCNTDSECLGLGGCTGGVCCQAATPGCAACGLPHVPEYTAELSCRGGGCSVQHTFSVDGWRSGSSEAYLTLEQSGDLNNELGHEYTTLRVGEWTLGKCNTDSLFWRVCPQTDDRDVAMDVAADGVLTVAATASAGVTVYEGPTNSTLGVRLRLRVVVPSGQCERCTLPLVLQANGSCTIATTATTMTATNKTAEMPVSCIPPLMLHTNGNCTMAATATNDSTPVAVSTSAATTPAAATTSAAALATLSIAPAVTSPELSPSPSNYVAAATASSSAPSSLTDTTVDEVVVLANTPSTAAPVYTSTITAAEGAKNTSSSSSRTLVLVLIVVGVILMCVTAYACGKHNQEKPNAEQFDSLEMTSIAVCKHGTNPTALDDNRLSSNATYATVPWKPNQHALRTESDTSISSFPECNLDAMGLPDTSLSKTKGPYDFLALNRNVALHADNTATSDETPYDDPAALLRQVTVRRVSSEPYEDPILLGRKATLRNPPRTTDYDAASQQQALVNPAMAANLLQPPAVVGRAASIHSTVSDTALDDQDIVNGVAQPGILELSASRVQTVTLRATRASSSSVSYNTNAAAPMYDNMEYGSPSGSTFESGSVVYEHISPLAAAVGGATSSSEMPPYATVERRAKNLLSNSQEKRFSQC